MVLFIPGPCQAASVSKNKPAFWDEWRGDLLGNPVMLIKRLFRKGDFRVDLHCFIRADKEGCFHTHPRWAFRLVLWGGYTEELESGKKRFWFPGKGGFVSPSYCHRIHSLSFYASFSLWIRFPTKLHKVELRGPGWDLQR